MRVLLLSCCALLSPAATLTIQPPVIYDCNGTFGKAKLHWAGASGPVQLLVGSSHAVFTGLSGTSGSVETGTWVGDGLEFQLVNQAGNVEATATARVQCDARRVPGNGIIGTSYLPLEVGNRWVYKVNSRFGTSEYITWTVTGTRLIGARTYAQITSTSGANSIPGLLLREASDGTIWRHTITGGVPGELPYLRPAASTHHSYQNALGSFPDAVFQNNRDTLLQEDQVFVRGIGLARANSRLMTGSSGGFVSSMELIEFQLATGPLVQVAAPRISVTAERSLFNLMERLTDNCAIPCYYPACGLGSPVDPPNTYKPCARTRIEVAAEGDFSVNLTLADANGKEWFQSALLSGSGELVQYVQLPLFSEPNKPLPAGSYRLTVRMLQANVETATAAMTIELR